MQVNYKTALGTTSLESKVIINGKKHSHNKFLITVSDLQPKQITIQEDHNIHTYSLIYLVFLAVENSREPLFLIWNI